MRKFSIIAVLLFLLMGCVNVNETIDIAEINHYQQDALNEQLAIDLLYYNYDWFIIKEVPELTKEDFKFIRWQHFTQQNSGKNFIRLVFNYKTANLKKNRDKLVAFFTKSVNQEMELLTANEDNFKEAQTFADECLHLMDKGNMGKLYTNMSTDYNVKQSKQDFSEVLTNFVKSNGKVTSRTFHSKQFLTELPGIAKGKFFRINYKTTRENSKEILESVVAVKEKGTWQFVGITLR
jgi:hypothetical protein